MKRVQSRAAALARLCWAFLVLSLLLNINYPAKPFVSWATLLPSSDVWLLLIVLAIAARWGRHFVTWTTSMVWALFLALRLIRIGDSAVPMFLNRPFNLYIDSGYLFGLYDLLKTSSRQGDFLWFVSIGAAVALLVAGLSWRAFRIAGQAVADTLIRRGFLGLSACLLAGAVLWRLTEGEEQKKLAPPALRRLGQEILFISQVAEQQRAFADRLQQSVRERAALPSSLNRLQGADVLLFLVESYGRTVFSQPYYRQAMAATMQRLAAVLDRQGLAAVSSYLTASTYGGSSWLTHGTLESGLRVADDLEYTALLRSALPPLAAYFKQAGYRTVSVMPGTRFAFPEGAYFGYEQVYYAWHFDYRGPAFGWSPMPDQFVLDWVRRREFGKGGEAGDRQRPRFVRYVLISSHAAFNRQPPFVADWDAIGDGRLYGELAAVTYPIAWPDLSHAGEAYLRALDYEFEVLGSYLARYLRPGSLVIIMGDHQPNRQLTGEDEPWSVPVHIISGNPSLLEPFRQRGYTPGLTPDQAPPHAGMETFLAGFLADFSDRP